MNVLLVVSHGRQDLSPTTTTRCFHALLSCTLVNIANQLALCQKTKQIDTAFDVFNHTILLLEKARK